MYIRWMVIWFAGVSLLGSAGSLRGQDGGPKLRVLEGHEGSVLGLVFTPDSETLASSARDNVICIWDMATGQLRRKLAHHTDDIYGLAISPDGSMLVSGSADKTICLWKLPSLELVRTLTGHQDIVRSTTFSPDGKMLASCGADLTVRLWEVETGQQKHVMRGHEARVQSVVFSEDGRLLASGGDGVRIWDPVTGELLGALESPVGQFETIVFAPGGRTLAGSSSAGPVLVWDAAAQKLLRVLEGHTREADSVSFSPDGTLMATGSKDTTIRLYDTKTWKLIRILTGNKGRIESLEFSPDGKVLVHGGGGGDSTITVWDLPAIRSQGGLVQVYEHFDEDPGWKGFQNRIVADHPPTISQNFGWSHTAHTGGLPGEIGGTFHRSRTMAYYALPLGRPLTFDDHFSAEGTVTLMPREKQGGACIGFFNHQRQEWRPWNSIVWRIGDYPRDGEIHVDYMAANWMAGGLRLPDLLPGDGKPHAWHLEYEPDARPNTNWKSAVLMEVMPQEAMPESRILELAQARDPEIHAHELRAQLEQAQDQGLVGSKNMGAEYHGSKNGNPELLHGCITFQLAGGRKHAMYLLKEHRQSPASFDRFGVFNFQLYGRHWEFYDNESTGVETEFYIGKLIINGEPVELAHDPYWEGVGNRATFVDADFHGRHDYGYSQTQWAGGERPGEVGGTIWRNEAIDPMHSFYAADVGELTLDDPIRFAGKLAFVNGATDGDAIIGYFNEHARMQQFNGGNRAYPPDLAQQLGARSRIHLGFDGRAARLPGTLGFTIGGATSEGYCFTLVCVPTNQTASAVKGPLIRPDGALHTFSLDYNPHAGEAGRITATLDDESFTMDLTQQQRQAGATLNLFGLTMPRQGGKWVTLYIDDVEYTALQYSHCVRYPQEIIRVRYPEGGRAY